MDASVDPSGIFQSASAAFERGEFADAAAGFEAARAAGMTGPAVDYNLGVSYYRLGDYPQAETVFRAIAAQHRDMQALAEYNLGLSLTRQGRTVEARSAFERAVRGNDPAIAALAEAMLARSVEAAPAPHAKPWFTLFDVALGYDDNVALIEEASVPTGASSGSPLLEVFGLLSGRPHDSSVRLDASAYVVRYSDIPAFDQEAVRFGVAYLWDWRDWRLDAGPHYNYSGLDGSGFERRLGASLNARYPFSDTAALSIRYVHDDVGELSREYAFVDGTRDRMSVGFERIVDGGGRLEIGYVHERNDRVDAAVSPTRNEIFAGYEHVLNADWSVEVHGLMRTSRYGELELPREEDLSQLSLTATRDFASGWQLLGQYRRADSASNVEHFSYDRNRFVVSLNRLF